jgi:hypothetical protein
MPDLTLRDSAPLWISYPMGISRMGARMGMISATETWPQRRKGVTLQEAEAMNIAMTERGMAATQALQDKVSLVTGSTSGIGLGIARALAGAGSSVILNGFGKPDEIAAAQDGIAADFGVKVAYPARTCPNRSRSPR